MEVHNYFFMHIILFVAEDSPLPKSRKDDFISYTRKSFTDKNCEVFACNGTSTHVHVLCRMALDMSIEEVIHRVRSQVEWELNKSFLEPRYFMDDIYYAFTISPEMIEDESDTIHNQEACHLQTSLKEELADIRQENGLEHTEDLYGTSSVDLN